MFSNNEERKNEMENTRARPIDMEQSSKVGSEEQSINSKDSC
jgi:hypothetical protein